MTESISVRVDLEIPAARVKYSKTTSAETHHVVDGGAMVYDLDDAGAIVSGDAIRRIIE